MIEISPFVYFIKSPNLPSFCVIDLNPDPTGGRFQSRTIERFYRPLKHVFSEALENIVMSFQGPLKSFLALLSCRCSTSRVM
jgi:hypothetical protein